MHRFARWDPSWCLSTCEKSETGPGSRCLAHEIPITSFGLRRGERLRITWWGALLERLLCEGHTFCHRMSVVRICCNRVNSRWLLLILLSGCGEQTSLFQAWRDRVTCESAQRRTPTTFGTVWCRQQRVSLLLYLLLVVLLLLAWCWHGERGSCFPRRCRCILSRVWEKVLLGISLL